MKTQINTTTGFIVETTYWNVYLHPDQYYLGRAVVVAKRDVGSMTDLTDKEWLDFAKLLRVFESVLKKSFSATMFNWTCLMNNAYQNNPPNPHVHWHVRPRYAKSVLFENVEFKDKEFGEHYQRGTNLIVSKKVFEKILERIREWYKDA